MTEAWPEHLLASSHKAWRSLTEETWEAIRRQYLQGVSARDLAARHEIGLSTVRLKAKEGGWRRTDQPIDPDLFPEDADRWAAAAEDDFIPDAGDESEADDWRGMADLARFRLSRAMRAGRATEAASWMRLYERLTSREAAAVRSGAPDPEVASAPDASPAPPPAEPDPLEAVEDSLKLATRIASLGQRSLRVIETGDYREIDAIEREMAELEALTGAAAAPPLDSLDSLDSLFSQSGPARPHPRQPSSSRNRCSSGVVSRPNARFRCGKRPKRAMMA